MPPSTKKPYITRNNHHNNHHKTNKIIPSGFRSLKGLFTWKEEDPSTREDLRKRNKHVIQALLLSLSALKTAFQEIAA